MPPGKVWEGYSRVHYSSERREIRPGSQTLATLVENNSDANFAKKCITEYEINDGCLLFPWNL